MNTEEAKDLISGEFSDSQEFWADLGCGKGAFTYALAELLPAESKIYAVDLQKQNLRKFHKEVSIDFQQGNFENNELIFPLMNGILIANSLHFVKHKKALIKRLEKYFKQNNEKWIIVEYDHSVPNQWEPYPIPFDELKLMFSQLGYSKIEKVSERKSVFGGKMYSAFITKI